MKRINVSRALFLEQLAGLIAFLLERGKTVAGYTIDEVKNLHEEQAKAAEEDIRRANEWSQWHRRYLDQQKVRYVTFRKVLEAVRAVLRDDAFAVQSLNQLVRLRSRKRTQGESGSTRASDPDASTRSAERPAA